MKYKINDRVVVKIESYNLIERKILYKKYTGIITKYVNLNLMNGKIWYKVKVEKLGINVNITEKYIERKINNNIIKL